MRKTTTNNIRFVFFFIPLFFTLTLFADENKPLPPGYAVASAHPLATNAGLKILSNGGNAFDAAIAVAAVLAVVEPYHSGLGGGGFWLLHDEKAHKNIFIDSRETAPLAAKEDMYLAGDGTVVPKLSLNGGLAAAIPGEPAALVYIAKNYGRLPLASTLAPAIKLAEKGFLVDEQLHFFLSNKERLEQIKKYPETALIFLKNGRPYKIGERLIQTDLAKTLNQIVKNGAQGFYSGKVAKLLVKGVNDAGGIWTLKDLTNYHIKLREPLVGAYHNMLVITAPPPSAGGIALITMLNILSHYSLSSYSKVEWMHYLIESMRLAYWQRDKFLGDPDFIKIPIEHLLSYENGKQLSSLISPKKATPSKVLRENVYQSNHEKDNSNNTTHISILDAEGNRVSATLTINYIFGSSVVAKGTGVLLNDEMDDFSIKVGKGNVFGIIGSVKNAIAPGKRPLSNMTPTFLELPNRMAILGTPGGSRIPTMVLLASLIFNDSLGAISMVSSMRFHHQYLPDVLQVEPESISSEIHEALKAMGYSIMQLKQYYGDMQAITWDKSLNILTAASDPREMGLAVSVVTSQSGYGIKY